MKESRYKGVTKEIIITHYDIKIVLMIIEVDVDRRKNKMFSVVTQLRGHYKNHLCWCRHKAEERMIMKV